MDNNEFSHKYFAALKKAQDIFFAKVSDYGPTWKIFRWVSIADQLWIKAKRIHTLEMLNDNGRVGDTRLDEYLGIINYCIVALMKYRENGINDDITLNDNILTDYDLDKLTSYYTREADGCFALAQKKNHDYGGAWQDMSIVSITDQILIKILRIKNILSHSGVVKVSENIDAQFADIFNYCIFAVIKLGNAAN